LIQIYLKKENKPKKFEKRIFVDTLKIAYENNRIADPNPEPLARGMDPRIRICIRIRTKISWIRNTGFFLIDGKFDRCVPGMPLMLFSCRTYLKELYKYN
jgi:hypothetical protein